MEFKRDMVGCICLKKQNPPPPPSQEKGKKTRPQTTFGNANRRQMLSVDQRRNFALTRNIYHEILAFHLSFCALKNLGTLLSFFFNFNFIDRKWHIFTSIGLIMSAQKCLLYFGFCHLATEVNCTR